MERLYRAWRRGDPDQRARIVDHPELYRKIDDELGEGEPSPTDRVDRDLGVVYGVRIRPRAGSRKAHSTSFHTCARLNGGAIRCWGLAAFGMLGDGNTIVIGDDETPASAGDIDVGGPALDIAAGRYHTCARLDEVTVRCWGYAQLGQLGYGNTRNIGDDETPASVGPVVVF